MTPAAPESAQAPESALGTTVRVLRWGHHAIAAVLVAVGVARGLTDAGPGTTAVHAAFVVLAGLALLGWYALGATRAGRATRAARATRPAQGPLPAGSPERPRLPTRSQPHRAALWLAGLAALWLLALAASAEFMWFAFVLWLLAGHLLRSWRVVAFAVLVYAGVILAPLLHHGATTYATLFGPLIGGVFALGMSRGYLQLLRDARERERLVASLTQAQRDMAELQDELAHSQRVSGAIEERTRISRDLHDTVAQSLSSIRLLAHAERERSSTLNQVEGLALDALTDVRRIVAALAPAELEGGALPAALARVAAKHAEVTGMRVDLHVDESVPHLDTRVEVTLLRAAQSALANAHRHGAARRVAVSLIDAGEAVRLDVRDDGRGFDTSALSSGRVGPDARDPQSSFGLGFLRARLRELGGGLDVESAPGEGTALSAFVPLTTPARPELESPRSGESLNEAPTKGRLHE